MSAAALRGVLLDKDGTLLEFTATWMPAYRVAAAAVCALPGAGARPAALLQAGGLDPLRGRFAPGSPPARGAPAVLRLRGGGPLISRAG